MNKEHSQAPILTDAMKLWIYKSAGLPTRIVTDDKTGRVVEQALYPAAIGWINGRPTVYYRRTDQ